MALCTVSGNFTDISGTPIEFVKVKASIVTPFFNGNSFIPPTESETISDDDGDWSLALIQGASVDITIEYPPNDTIDYTDSFRRLSYTIEVPSASTASFSNLVEEF